MGVNVAVASEVIWAGAELERQTGLERQNEKEDKKLPDEGAGGLRTAGDADK